MPRAALLGAVTAIAAMIPFGAVIAFGLAAVLAVAQGSLVAGAVVFAMGLVVLGVADQAVSSATNYLTAFVASLVLVPEAFGAFVVAYAVVAIGERLAAVRFGGQN